MRLKVISTQVFDRKVRAKVSGKEYVFREQEALVTMGPETRIIVMGLEEGQAAYPLGEYDVLDTSFDVDGNRNLAFKRRLALKPVVPVASQARVAG